MIDRCLKAVQADHSHAILLPGRLQSVYGENKYEREPPCVSAFQGFRDRLMLMVSKSVNIDVFLLADENHFKRRTSAMWRFKSVSEAASAFRSGKSVFQHLYPPNVWRRGCAWFGNFPIAHRIESY